MVCLLSGHVQDGQTENLLQVLSRVSPDRAQPEPQPPVNHEPEVPPLRAEARQQQSVTAEAIFSKLSSAVVNISI